MTAASHEFRTKDPRFTARARRGPVGDDESRGGCRSTPVTVPQRPHHLDQELTMTATYTFDVFSSLDGYGAASGDWTGYWGKQGPELLDHRLDVYSEDQRMVFGANTFRAFVDMLADSTMESEVRDPWVTRAHTAAWR